MSCHRLSGLKREGGTALNDPGTSAELALVSGAAGDIGRETLAALRAAGWLTVGWDLHVGPGVRVCDLLAEDNLLRETELLRREGQLKHVVHVAGGGDAEELSCASVTDESATVFERVLRVNLVTAFNLIRHTVPLLREAVGDRSITLISSINALGGYGAPGYSAAKAALSGLANSLVPELGSSGVRINTLLLGTTNTLNLAKLAAIRGQPLNLDKIAAQTATGRILEPVDVARAIVSIAVGLRGLTGADIILDNGQTIVRR